MEIVIKILQFIVSLSLLVIIHELGHFLFAKAFGVRVEKFYLFFDAGFSIVKFKIGETEYGIGWIPFGGYVKLAGMIDESMDTEQMKQSPQPYEFRSKPAWQRLLIMTGGVIMNVVLAIVIYIGMSYHYGDQYFANDDMKYGYVFNSLGHEAGFREGDRVLSVNGVYIENMQDVYKTILFDKMPPVQVQRGDETLTITIPQELMPNMLNEPGFMTPRMPFVIGKVSEGGAEKAGLIAGDSLVAINGAEMMFFDQYQKALTEVKGQTANITISRDSSGIMVQRTIPVKVSDEGMIGVNPRGPAWFYPVQTKHYNFWESIPAGFKRTGREISDYWKQIKLIFTPKSEAYKSLGGFLSIGSIFPGTWNWQGFWNITAFLSIILAVMNILPIPALDGGHVLFLLWEVITRRKPSDKFMEYAQMTGLFLLLALLIYANANDIYRFFIK